VLDDDGGVLTTPVEELHRAIWDTIGRSYPEPVRRLRGEVMTTGDFCSDRQWHSTGIYADLKRPSCAGKTLVIPLPGPPGVARRLVFLRGPGRPFGEEDRSAAVLLQPHICESLRLQARSSPRHHPVGECPLYSSSVTCFPQSISGRSPAGVASVMDKWVMKWPGAAPCQCHSSAGV